MDEKRKITEMFKRVSQFDVDWPSDIPEAEEEPLSRLAMLNLDTLAVEEIEAMLGDDLLDKFHASLKEDEAPLEFMQNIITTASEWIPWWISSKQQVKMVQDSSSDILKQTSEPPSIISGLPPFKQISSAAPSEFLWNNLVELMYLCIIGGVLFNVL